MTEHLGAELQNLGSEWGRAIGAFNRFNYKDKYETRRDFTKRDKLLAAHDKAFDNFKKEAGRLIAIIQAVCETHGSAIVTTATYSSGRENECTIKNERTITARAAFSYTHEHGDVHLQTDYGEYKVSLATIESVKAPAPAAAP